MASTLKRGSSYHCWSSILWNSVTVKPDALHFHNCFSCLVHLREITFRAWWEDEPTSPQTREPFNSKLWHYSQTLQNWLKVWFEDKINFLFFLFQWYYEKRIEDKEVFFYSLTRTIEKPVRSKQDEQSRESCMWRKKMLLGEPNRILNKTFDKLRWP